MENPYSRLKRLIRCDTDVLDPMIPAMYTPQEIRLIEETNGKRFTALQAAEVLEIAVDEAERLLGQGYAKGIWDQFPEETPTGYAPTEMYSVLDYFVLGNYDLWRAYPRESVLAADAWYFREYGRRVEQRMCTEDQRPSEIVLPLEQALRYIEELPHELYVLPCDCRSIRGGCDHTREVCIQSVEVTVNSVIHRGFGRGITKEEAKELVREADAEGLIHSPTPYHFCNCCTDCCYPFRYSKLRGSRRQWPRSLYLARVDVDACVGCGLCAKRCPVDAVTVADRKAVVDETACVGCGVCRVPCKKDAITMTELGDTVPAPQ